MVCININEIELAQDRIRRQNYVHTIIDLGVAKSEGIS
jgi:hypothetical protein